MADPPPPSWLRSSAQARTARGRGDEDSIQLDRFEGREGWNTQIEMGSAFSVEKQTDRCRIL
ncbi:hypothetical protein SYNGFB01_11990 [Synechococcus sp. GFB01]|nr:hypothetical protein SYNGFB01_11990 [Synechococcus sp. GFB01]